MLSLENEVYGAQEEPCFGEDSCLLGKYSPDELAVLGLCSVVGDRKSWSCIVQPARLLRADEVAGSVPLTEFTLEDGSVVLPQTADEFFEHIAA